MADDLDDLDLRLTDATAMEIRRKLEQLGVLHQGTWQRHTAEALHDRAALEAALREERKKNRNLQEMVKSASEDASQARAHAGKLAAEMERLRAATEAPRVGGRDHALIMLEDRLEEEVEAHQQLREEIKELIEWYNDAARAHMAVADQPGGAFYRRAGEVYEMASLKTSALLHPDEED